MPSGMRILRALSKRAQAWVEENVHYKEWQLIVGGIAGDWRMMEQIREVMLDEGFRDSKRWWQFWRKVDFEVC